MDDLRYKIALLMVKGVNNAKARHIIEAFGSARAVFEADKTTLLALPRIGEAIIAASNDQQIFDRADHELQFMADHHIQPLCYGADNYPHRLLECQDAPAVLFQLGQPVTEARHVVGIVGTRECTQYGRDITTRFVNELHEIVPDLLVVSGLALGIDITAHRAALQNHVPTTAVVAHGLDQIYPTQHRNEAKQIITQGGSIVCDYVSKSGIAKQNFLERNRLIAGLSDAILVAESKDKGGSLVTASIALDYGRDVFAFPGRVGDTRSNGCNRLIRLNRAGLITSAEDFVEAMNWGTAMSKPKSIQHSIPFEEENLTPNARLILDALRDRGDMQLPLLSEVTGLDHTAIYEEMLDLEMDGKVRSTPGGLYQLR